MAAFKSHFPEKIDLYFRKSNSKYSHPYFGNVKANNCFPVSNLQKSRKSCENWSGKTQPTLTINSKKIDKICIVSRNLTYGNFYSMQTRSLSALIKIDSADIVEDNSTLQGITVSSDGNFYYIVDLYEDEFYPPILENGMSKGGEIEGPFEFVYVSPGNLKLCYSEGKVAKGAISEKEYLKIKEEKAKKKKKSGPKVGVDYLSASEIKPGFVYGAGTYTRNYNNPYSLVLEKSGGEYVIATAFKNLKFDPKAKNKLSFSYAELSNSDNDEIVNYPQNTLIVKNHCYGGPQIENVNILNDRLPFYSSYKYQKAARGAFDKKMTKFLGYKVSVKNIIKINKRQIVFEDQEEYFKFLLNSEFFVQKCIDFYNEMQVKLGFPCFKEDNKKSVLTVANLNYKNKPVFDSFLEEGKDYIEYAQRKLQLQNNFTIVKVKGNPKFGSKLAPGIGFDSDLVNYIQKSYNDNKDKVVLKASHKIWE